MDQVEAQEERGSLSPRALGRPCCRPCETLLLLFLQPLPQPIALLILQVHSQALGLGLCSCCAICLECPSQPLPPGLVPTCVPSISLSNCLWEVCPDTLGQVRSGLWPSLAVSMSIILARP